MSTFTLTPISRYHERYMTREHGQMLLIPHAREADNGEYCCLAINGVGEPAKSCGALQLKMSESCCKVPPAPLKIQCVKRLRKPSI